MNAGDVRSVSCQCQAPLGRPCTPDGDHLARYLRADTAGVISRDLLKAAIASIDVLAAHAVVALADPRRISIRPVTHPH